MPKNAFDSAGAKGAQWKTGTCLNEKSCKIYCNSLELQSKQHASLFFGFVRFFVRILFENIREWLAINSCVLTFLQQITFHTIYFHGCCIILVASVGCSFFSTFHISKLKQGFCYRPFPSTFLLNSSFPVYFLLRMPCIYPSLSRTF